MGQRAENGVRVITGQWRKKIKSKSLVAGRQQEKEQDRSAVHRSLFSGGSAPSRAFRTSTSTLGLPFPFSRAVRSGRIVVLPPAVGEQSRLWGWAYRRHSCVALEFMEICHVRQTSGWRLSRGSQKWRPTIGWHQTSVSDTPSASQEDRCGGVVFDSPASALASCVMQLTCWPRFLLLERTKKDHTDDAFIITALPPLVLKETQSCATGHTALRVPIDSGNRINRPTT